jgi:copper homeostasis protein
MSQVLVEICIESVDDARFAAGADRLELCQALAVGGLTPSVGVQEEVRRVARVPVMTMVRPRPGGFCYGETEFAVMRRDIDAAIELGAEGVVFGILTESGAIDVRRTNQIIGQVRSAGRPVEVVFHRAFDFTPDPIEAIEQLIDLGVTRLLTSGQQPTAMEGVGLIRELVQRAAGRIQVLPGSGVRPENVGELVRRTGCDQVHASLRTAGSDRSTAGRVISLSAGGPGGGPDPSFTATDAGLVQSLLANLSRMRA